MPQTLYTETHAPGAMPLIGPRSTPNTGAEATGLPADGGGGVGAVAVAVAGGVERLGSGAAGVGQVGVEERARRR